MGLGAAPTVVCAMTLGSQWFPQRLFPLLAALTSVRDDRRGVGAGDPRLHRRAIGLRIGMIVCGRGVGGADATGGRVRPESPHVGCRYGLAPVSRDRRLLTSLPILARGTAGGLVSSAGVAFGMLWGVSYFQTYHHMSLSAASVCSSFYFWGCLPGIRVRLVVRAGWEAGSVAFALGALGNRRGDGPSSSTSCTARSPKASRCSLLGGFSTLPTRCPSPW